MADQYPRLDACFVPTDSLGRAQVHFRAASSGARLPGPADLEMSEAVANVTVIDPDLSWEGSAVRVRE